MFKSRIHPSRSRRAGGGRALRARTVWRAGMVVCWFAVLAGFGTAGCTREAADSRPVEAGVAVLVSAADVVAVQVRRLESGVFFTGDLQPFEVVDVVARFDGDLEKVLVREGESVEKGRALAMYKPDDVKDAWQAAESDFEAAQSELLASQNAERRTRRLLEAGAAAPSDLEAVVSRVAAAGARVRAAEALRNRATEDSDRLNVPSPITGRVAKVFVNSGARTAIGDPLFTVVDTRTLELSATISSEELGRVEPGAVIRFTVPAYPGEVFTGVVDRVNPTTEPGTRQVRLYTRVPNPDQRLVGGLFASGRLVDNVKEQACSAPLSVIRQEGTQQVVYRVRQGRAQRVPVRTGLVDEALGIAELIGDVAPGDSLLTGVLPGLRDGASVRILKGSEEKGGPSAASTNRESG